MSIIKGILSNGLANVVQKLVRIADQLLLVPFFLTYWGAAMYARIQQASAKLRNVFVKALLWC